MSALTTHTFDNQREKEKGKETTKRNSNKRSKAEERQRAISLEEHKSRTPLARATT
jgi:Na+-transporting methylmalonyl-CoA/oxaloacetate decarboxylase gamma subunit